MSESEPWYAAMAGEVPTPGEDKNVVKLLVGSLSAAESFRFLNDVGITHVLTVASGLDVKISNSSIKHKTVDCHDHPMENILKVLPECLEFIDEALLSGRILVHCASGVSRSVAVCAAFLMTRHGMTAGRAIQTIRARRKYANPNIGFKRQLDILEQAEGDISGALDTWSRQSSDVVAESLRQREAVNSFHSRVDEIELIVARIPTKESGETATLRRALIAIQFELDPCLPAEGDGFVDPPARMIRRSAIAKTERLLASLDAVKEESSKK